MSQMTQKKERIAQTTLETDGSGTDVGRNNVKDFLVKLDLFGMLSLKHL